MMNMVYCPPGEFWMGSQDGVGYDNERPRHRVKLSRGFWMGQTQVTQGLWEKVMGNNPSYFKGAQRPVESVSWFDAVRFCNALSRAEGLTSAYMGDNSTVSLDVTANGYRLPMEAEWEYAAKAGTELKYSGGDEPDAVVWYSGNTENKTHPVGTKKANAWGIYDMCGNVWEWCSDQWDAEAYKQRSGRVTDPHVYATGPSPRVIRGGYYGGVAFLCRVAYRNWSRADICWDDLGFRVCRPAS
jgi:sulfatase modifying factor 1